MFKTYEIKQAGRTIGTETFFSDAVGRALHMSSQPEITIECEGKVVCRVYDGQVTY